jgi:hypothetical protein
MKEKSKAAKEKEKSLDELDTDVTLDGGDEAAEDELEDEDGDEEETEGRSSAAADLLVTGALSDCSCSGSSRGPQASSRRC